jgi:hypothetical protein
MGSIGNFEACVSHRQFANTFEHHVSVFAELRHRYRHSLHSK